ncbi:hypothetical protein F5883DRAFT_164252 [Diaporthe sp. PMI_573]|nr:hypothetical protein F5883DRAFT_164252 [Diaporthaceae sp. PMI_573]
MLRVLRNLLLVVDVWLLPRTSSRDYMSRLGQIATSAMDRTQLASRIESRVGFRPRPGQVEAVYKLVVDQQDLILIAPTGWGKSVVFQAVPALSGGICIMIMPLTLLEEDQT